MLLIGPCHNAAWNPYAPSGEVDVYLMEPRYHGDGAGGKSPVYTDWGEDLLMDLQEIEFDTTVHVHHPSAEVDEAATLISRKGMMRD